MVGVAGGEAVSEVVALAEEARVAAVGVVGVAAWAALGEVMAG